MEGAGVSGFVAEVEGEELGVGDLAGLLVEAAGLEVRGAVGEPVRFGHGVNQDGLGFGGWLMFVGERGF